MFLTIISFLFVFTLITIVHEMGHLYFSKRAGIRVHEFGVGFGPTLFSTKRNNTTYKINLLPILGYVKIAGLDGDEEEEKTTPDDEKYYNKPVAAKFFSIFAGAFMNLILGFLIFCFVFLFTGIPAGISNEISAISPGSEAAKIGLTTGDRLLSIDGKSYKNVEDAVKYIHKNPGTKILLKVDRAGKTLRFAAIPEKHQRLKVGLIGFALKPLYEKASVFSAVYHGAKQTFALIVTVLALFGRLIIGKIALTDLAGPVGIAQITGQYAHQGFLSLMSFTAFFSINVAVLNLLPIPALDGGRLFFLIIEAIRRKSIDIKTENKIHTIGLIVLLSFLALLTVNDFWRILRH